MFGRVKSAEKEVKLYIRHLKRTGQDDLAYLNQALLESDEFQQADEEERWQILITPEKFERVARNKLLDLAAEKGVLKEALDLLTK